MGRYRVPLKDRFKTKYVVSPDGCWLWTGSKEEKGYGRLHMTDGGTKAAHRLSYELHVGPIPDGMHVLHSCDNPSCVNPEHLRPGTNYENWAEARDRGKWVPGKGVLVGTAVKTARLDDEKVRDIRKREMSAMAYAVKYGVHLGTVLKVLSGERWLHVK